MMPKKLTEIETEKEETERKAYLICLAEPVNNAIYGVSLQTENLLAVLKKAKNKKDFEDGLVLFNTFCDHQEKLIAQLKKLVVSVQEKQNPEPVQKVH